MRTPAGKDHPTRQKLIQSILDLSKNTSLQSIHSYDVLEHSGISKGSLYHHFENFQDLVEDAHLERFADSVQKLHKHTNEYLPSIITSAPYEKNFIKVLKFISGPSFKAERINMIHCITLMENNHGFSQKIRPHLNYFDNFLEHSLLKELKVPTQVSKADQERAVVIARTLFFGRAAEDLKTSPISNIQWNRFLDSIQIVKVA